MCSGFCARANYTMCAKLDSQSSTIAVFKPISSLSSYFLMRTYRSSRSVTPSKNDTEGRESGHKDSCANRMLQNESIQQRLKSLISTESSPLRKNGHDDFSFGMKAKDGRTKRKEWLALEEMLTKIQGLTSMSIQRTSLSAQQKLLHDLRASIVNACYYIVEGRNLEAQFENSRKFTQ